MFPSVEARGVREAYSLLRDVAGRARDASPAWDKVTDDVFAFQRRWWLMTYGSRRDKEHRAGRDPRLMHETGGLEQSATRRGALRQTVHVAPTFVLIEVTHGLAVIHEARGRPVLGEPGPADVDRYAGRVADFILTGRT